MRGFRRWAPERKRLLLWFFVADALWLLVVVAFLWARRIGAPPYGSPDYEGFRNTTWIANMALVLGGNAVMIAVFINRMLASIKRNPPPSRLL